MTEDNKSKTGAVAGGVGGATAGAGGGIAAVSAAGTTAGLSGPGIMAGLAAIGGTAIGGIIVLIGGTLVLTAGGAYCGYKLATRHARK